jgi:hypothetical protein
VETGYVLSGLRLVADGDIPGLSRCPLPQVADVRVWLNTMPADARGGQRIRWYQSEVPSDRARPHLVIWRMVPEGAFHFVYDDRTEFLVQPDGRQVWCVRPDAASLADTAVYLRGPVLGLVLRLLGHVCLHASAVAAGGAAVALLGAAGRGKSTTAAGFVSLGFPLLADDVTALHTGADGVAVLPAYPRLNLWPDAARALYGTACALPRLTPAGGINDWWDKRYRDLEVGREFHPEPLPLAAVYVLGERASDDRAPRIEPLSPRDAFMTLVDGSYVNYALDEGMRATEFEVLGRLVRSVPVRLVTAPDHPTRVLDLCAAILGDYDGLAAPAGRR